MIKAQEGRVQIEGARRGIKVEFVSICDIVYSEICKGDNEEFMGLVDGAMRVAMMSDDEKDKVAELFQELTDIIYGGKNDEED